MKKFLGIGIISVLVVTIFLIGQDNFYNKKVNELEARVFEINKYINNDDLLNADMMVNIIKKENYTIGDNEINQKIREIEEEIKNKRNLSNIKSKKTLDNLDDTEKDLELLNIYLENNEVSSDVKAINTEGENYYMQYRKKNNLEYDKNKDFSKSKGYILKSVGENKRLKEDTCLVFDANKPYYINNDVYYKFKEIPVSTYFGEGSKYTWFLTDLNFNIVNKGNLEFYIKQDKVKNYKHETINDSEINRYLNY